MLDVLLRALALLCCTAGFAWLALSMERHWEQVRGAQPLPRRTVIGLRVLGGAALLGSLLLCLRVDHASMASLVWVMSLAASALVVAFTLTWRPRWMTPLLPWMQKRDASAARKA
ncbi:DUF3325 domain-containing protein [Methylibium sp. Pch-M]|uniref:DUF3325 domain-containing protein n=1 Tax=Methylibium sp. Pch-M TaxID=2082386 RepID=UPI001010B846|nr:DUF3325 domain-containing protein [Methylibium sp. Pch-M]QAZ40562.1 DUF3325 domain-containing protein [Methylibium sp. Pch-M]